jgi:hypothetical protein
MILQLQLWKKDGLQKKQTVLGKKISTNQFCSWQIIVYALSHQVVPNNFELFCLWFILVEDCAAILNVPLHIGGERGIKKTSSVTTKPTKIVLKTNRWNKGTKKRLT